MDRSKLGITALIHMEFTGSALPEEYWDKADNVHYVRIQKTGLEAYGRDVIRRLDEMGYRFPAREGGGAVRLDGSKEKADHDGACTEPKLVTERLFTGSPLHWYSS